MVHFNFNIYFVEFFLLSNICAINYSPQNININYKLTDNYHDFN